MKILLVEDQDFFILQVKRALEGHEVTAVHSFEKGVEVLDRRHFDMVITDVALEGSKTGLDLCAYIRGSEVHRYVQILILSQKDSEAEKMAGLNGGADDYLPKPFGVGELRSRVEARLRRAKGPPLVRVVGYLEFNLISRKVRNLRRDIEMPLSDTEFRILFLLAGECGKVFSLEEIADKASVSPSRIKVHISKIRQLIEGEGLIRPIRGSGYFYEVVYTWQHVS